MAYFVWAHTVHDLGRIYRRLSDPRHNHKTSAGKAICCTIQKNQDWKVDVNKAIDIEETKYTRVEYERRSLVLPRADWKSALESYSKAFEDKYLRDTRLRLRILTDSDTGRRVLKLNKKHESASPYFRTNVGIKLTSQNLILIPPLKTRPSVCV